MVIEGIIRPPPEIRAVADRTALFVSKNGRAFERRILNSDKGKTPKFAFLHETSPFHAYYEDRIRFYEEGGTEEEEKRKKEEEARKKEEEEQTKKKEEEERKKEEDEVRKRRERARKASALDPVARALLAQRSRIAAAAERQEKDEKKGDGDDGDGGGKGSAPPEAAATGPLPPPPLRFLQLAPPSNVSPVQVDVIKLTAQYAALSGRASSSSSSGGGTFLRELTRREWQNPTFAFLQPRHGHFAYFTALVDLYRRILGESVERMGKKSALGLGLRERYIPPKTEEERRREEEDVVAICAEGGVNKALELAAYRAEYDRYREEKKREEEEREGGGGRLGGAGGIDWHDFVVVETVDFAADEVVAAVPPPPPLPPPPPPPPPPKAEEVEAKQGEDEMDESSSDEDMEEEDDDEDDGGEQIKVVPEYKPRVVSTADTARAEERTHVIDPITGRSIPVSDLSEHMRIQLLDPKWTEERRKFLEKQRETNIVGGEDIAGNLDRFAKEKGAMFGSSEQELLNQDAEAKKRREEANRILREQAQGAQPRPPPSTTISAPPIRAAAVAAVAPPSRVLPPPPPPPPPKPAATAPPPPPQPAASAPPVHTRPESEETPPAKKVRIEEVGAPPPPAEAPPVPPPPVAAAVAAPPPPPPPAAAPPAPPPGESAPAEKPSAEGAGPAALLPPDEFVSSLPSSSVSVSVRIPSDDSNSQYIAWGLNGQTAVVEVEVTSKVREVKERVRVDHLGGNMPLNKMQLRRPGTGPGTGFLKDGTTLAQLNIGSGVVLDLVPKTRGGRK